MFWLSCLETKKMYLKPIEELTQPTASNPTASEDGAETL
jgi:hypothetical protein